MIKQSLFALFLTGLTVVIHAAGTVYLAIPAAGVWKRPESPQGLPRPMWTLTRLVSFLLVLHLVEMSVWAVAYTIAGLFPDFETSLYYSLKSYTTVGYGDVLPPPNWRLLGPIEAAVGILMLGWSTSIIVAPCNASTIHARRNRKRRQREYIQSRAWFEVRPWRNQTTEHCDLRKTPSEVSLRPSCHLFDGCRNTNPLGWRTI
ncbi:MAG TPA: potassium channel family protein [Pirellulales bacterium]|jgi:hypothetical protein